MKVKNRYLRHASGAKGFTLVEVLVVAAILGVMIVGSMQFMTYMQRVNKSGVVGSELVQVRQLVSSWLESEQICTQTFGGLGLNANNPVTQIVRSAGPPADVVYALGQRLPGTNWAVTEMRLLNRVEAAQVFPSYNGEVDDTGVGTGLFEVTIRQMRAGSNDQTVTLNEDRGNFTSAEKVLHFPFQASFAFGDMLRVVNLEDDAVFSDTVGSTACTWAARSASISLIDPAATQANTRVQWANSDGLETLSSGSFLCPSMAGVSVVCFEHRRMCNYINVNMPITRCIPPGSGLTI